MNPSLPPILATSSGPTSSPGWTLAQGRLFNVDPAEVGRAAMENGSGMRAEDALILIGGLITLLSLISLIGWLRRQKLRPSAGLVFLRVARSLGLTAGDCLLLLRIGRDAGQASPLALLLCPGTLGRCARDFAHRQPPRRRAPTLARAASVRRHLFTPPPPEVRK